MNLMKKWAFRGVLLAALTAGLTSALMSLGIADTLAITYNFRANNDGLPVSARTDFFDMGANPDLTNTAHHELLHAIGFTIAYNRFSNHVRNRDDNTGRRNFFRDPNDANTLLAILTHPDEGTHVDPNETVNNFNQANSIMRPTQVAGQRMGNFERDILNAAFGWTGRNLRINVEFRGTWTNEQRAAINDAVQAAQRLFNSDGTGHKFTWTVVPEPSSMAALAIGIAVSSCLARRRTRKASQPQSD